MILEQKVFMQQQPAWQGLPRVMAIKTVALCTICALLKSILFLLWTKISFRMRIVSVSILLYSSFPPPSKQCDLRGMSRFNDDDDDAFTLANISAVPVKLSLTWVSEKLTCPLSCTAFCIKDYKYHSRVLSGQRELLRHLPCFSTRLFLFFWLKSTAVAMIAELFYSVASMGLCQPHWNTAGYKLYLQNIL